MFCAFGEECHRAMSYESMINAVLERMLKPIAEGPMCASIWDDFEARLRDLVRTTFLPHNSSVLFRCILADCWGLDNIAVGAG